MPRGYGHNNYEFVIDSSFQPFSMQELLTPFMMYKDAYEKQEEAYEDLSSKADKFKYLSETLPEDSKARRMYEGYANELQAQANDLATNGLSMANRRALTGLKRRYQGEIGRLDLADQALQEERKLRRQLSAKDSSMLYANDNLSIDQFLDGSTPNLYNISGIELYTRGAAAGKAASSRIYRAGDAGRTLGGYYRDYVQRQGFNPDQLNQFQQEMLLNEFSKQVSVLPELQQAAQQILDANGVTENLTGNSLRKAQQQVIRGIIDGSVYNEDHKPVEDRGVMSASAKEQYALQREARDFERQTSGWRQDPKTKEWSYSEKDDLRRKAAVETAEAIARAKNAGKTGTTNGGTSSSGNSKRSQLTNAVKVTWKGSAPTNDQEANYNDPQNKTWSGWKNNTKEEYIDDNTTAHAGRSVPYVMLPYWAKEKADVLIGEGHPADYNFWISETGDSWIGDEPTLEIVPRKAFNGSSMSFDPAAIEALLEGGE